MTLSIHVQTQAAVTGEARSASWDPTASALIAVHVSSYSRAEYLPELFEALEQQDLAPEDYEVVVVDNASTDDTWTVLTELVERSPLRALGLRKSSNAGPAAARNLAVAASSAPVLAFTDDDCLPSPTWLSQLLAAMAPGVSVVQGRVVPPTEEWKVAGPWDHTKWIGRQTPFFETCNVAYWRDGFDSVGGFEDDDPLLNREGGSAFGEDAVLAWRVLRDGGVAAFASDAVVQHRCIQRSFRDHLRAQRNVGGFPGLARRTPIVSRWLKGGIFPDKRSAAFAAAVVVVSVAGLTRRPVLLAGTLPWGWLAARDATRRAKGSRRAALKVLPGVAVTDLVTFVSLVEGNIRYRRPRL